MLVEESTQERAGKFAAVRVVGFSEIIKGRAFRKALTDELIACPE